MKLAFCSELCDGLFEVSNDLDCLICCGNFLPIYDKELLTWNITNQVDWVDSTLNKWIERYPSTCFVFSGGPNDHLAKFYGSHANYYIKANYIQDELLYFKGLNIYSMPWLPPHASEMEPNAFKTKDASLYIAAVDSIPEETDILITWNHCYLHKNCKDIAEQGDLYLKKKVQSLRNLKIHSFGQSVEDNVILHSSKHLVVSSNRARVGPYTTVQI